MARKRSRDLISAAQHVGQPRLVRDAGCCEGRRRRRASAASYTASVAPFSRSYGPRLEQHLHEDVLRHHGPPGGAHQILRVLADGRVAVVGGDGDDRHVGVAEVVEGAPDELHVLAEAAGTVGRRHEEGDGVAALLVDDAQKVAHGDLLRVAFVARGHLAAQLERALVGVRRRPARRCRSSGSAAASRYEPPYGMCGR